MLARPFPRTKETLFLSISVSKLSTLIIPLISTPYSIAELQDSSSINNSSSSTTSLLGNSVLVNIGLKTLDTHNSINIDSLLDCGASGLFIDKQFVELNDITTRKL